MKPRPRGKKPVPQRLNRLRIIGGAWRGRLIAAGETQDIRPTSDRAREALFNRLLHGFADQGFRLQGARMADVFAGTGALGLEALSRGAAHVTFIERDPAAAALIRQNIATLGAEDRAFVLGADATTVPRAAEPCDLIVADPPYAENVAGAALAALARQHWLKPGALAAIETEASAPALTVAGFTTLDRRDYGRAAFTFLVFTAAT
ncbi:MAG: 16S rRNA (guanine(966)-N(2))-methyltransferase RsmD [Croceibacterium sp.]